MERFRTRLEEVLRGPLPGAAAQRRLAPQPRPGWDPNRAAPAGRPAAVLLLFYPGAADPRPAPWRDAPPAESSEAGGARPSLLLIERTGSVDWHRHQVAYPGGLIEAGESIEAAARREAWEEVGLEPESVSLLGRLSPLYVPATGFTIHPVVAISSHRPRLRRNAAEVARILETPLDFLLDPASVCHAESMMDRRWVRVPYYDLDGARLWGASAMITAELLALLGWSGPLTAER
jgi:8-oxo-dGTP pyrophosphatase MutT (NUDIX family)